MPKQSDMASTSSEIKEGIYRVVERTRAKKRRGRNQVGKEKSILEQLHDRERDLKNADYLSTCINLLHRGFTGEEFALEKTCFPTPASVICLGLGSITNNVKARDQYILFKAIVKEFSRTGMVDVRLYDPVMTDEDNVVHTADGFQTLAKAPELRCHEKTFLYMPHCPRTLFEELLSLNWSPLNLANIILWGNRLDMYNDPTHSSSLSRTRTPFINIAASFMRSIPLPHYERHQSFNDMALQWFPRQELPELSSEIWSSADRTGDELQKAT